MNMFAEEYHSSKAIEAAGEYETVTNFIAKYNPSVTDTLGTKSCVQINHSRGLLAIVIVRHSH